MKRSTFLVAILATAAIVGISACAQVQVGDNNLNFTCVGNCPDAAANTSGEVKKKKLKSMKGTPKGSDGPEAVVPSAPLPGASATSPAPAPRLAKEARRSAADKDSAKKKSKTRWYPWAMRTRNISRAKMALALSEDDRDVLRVPTKTFVRVIGGLGFDSPQHPKAFAKWVKSSEHIRVVACTQAILEKHYMSRTSENGKKIDLKWTRPKSECYEGEKLLVYVRDDGSLQPFLSLGCGNILTPKPEPKKNAGLVVKLS